jgi:hypothetical protein
MYLNSNFTTIRKFTSNATCNISNNSNNSDNNFIINDKTTNNTTTNNSTTNNGNIFVVCSENYVCKIFSFERIAMVFELGIQEPIFTLELSLEKEFEASSVGNNWFQIGKRGAVTEIFETTKTIEELFVIGKKIGEGSFSVVYGALSLETENPFAIKCIQKKDHEQDIKQIKHEIAVLQSFEHRNILPLYQIFEDPKQLWLVMDLAHSELAQWVTQNGPLQEQVTRVIVKQLLQVLHYLHETKKIIHRDLKPENILISMNFQTDNLIYL